MISQDIACRCVAVPPKKPEPQENRKPFWYKQDTKETLHTRAEEKSKPETRTETAKKIGQKEKLSSSPGNCQ